MKDAVVCTRPSNGVWVLMNRRCCWHRGSLISSSMGPQWSGRLHGDTVDGGPASRACRTSRIPGAVSRSFRSDAAFRYAMSSRNCRASHRRLSAIVTRSIHNPAGQRFTSWRSPSDDVEQHAFDSDAWPERELPPSSRFAFWPTSGLRCTTVPSTKIKRYAEHAFAEAGEHVPASRRQLREIPSERTDCSMIWGRASDGSPRDRYRYCNPVCP